MENMNQIKLCGLNCRKNIMLAGTKFMLPSKEKEDPEVPNISKRENKLLNQRQQHQLPIPLHQPYILTLKQALSSPPPENKNEWVHSVIFEPQLKIQLTQSLYKVTSFLDFQPLLRDFQSVNEYLKDLTKDINNPTYFQRIVSPFNNFQITPLSNETVIWKFLNSPACKVNPYACKFKMKLEQY